MDAVLHRERLSDGKKRLHGLPVPIGLLPDGAMVALGAESYLIARGQLLRWSFDGYHRADVGAAAMLLTPPSILHALNAGYQPVLHPSASSA
jgi:hypothetical protein